MEIHSDKPQVKLVAYTKAPYSTAIASARTCYAPKVVFPDDLTEIQKQRIGPGIYEAGHHTPFQHPTFIFSLENVSRQCLWSFFHSHPFFNSEQTSQRYVVHNDPNVFVPPLDNACMKVYKRAILDSWHAYRQLSELLIMDNFKLMKALGRAKGQSEKQISVESEKKAIENARYVLPVAAFSNLYHTISGIVFKRYVRMMNAGDTPYENRLVVEQMMQEIKKIDPDFITMVKTEPIDSNGIPENSVNLINGTDNLNKLFDQELENRTSKLVLYNNEAEHIMAGAVREVLGMTENSLPDVEALALILDPKKNAYLTDTLNSWIHSPLMRAMNHANYTFKKKISHTADSQDQRHRMTPASRPLLTRVHSTDPDYIVPDIVRKNDTALKIYTDTMNSLWAAKNRLIDKGISAEFACYLLPNAVSIRFTESGSLLHFLHKWRLRTCFNAQLEIYQNSMDEIEQVRKIHPNIAKYIGPPCFFRQNLVPYKDPEGPCPEGSRWCGIKVWMGFPDKISRPY